MDRKAILTDYIKQELLRGRAPNLSETDDLLESGIINSLGILQLIGFLEDNLGVVVPDEDVVYENFRSIAALSDYLDGH